MISVQEVIGVNGLRTNAIVCPQSEIKYVIFAKEMHDLLLKLNPYVIPADDKYGFFDLMNKIHSHDEE